MTLFEKHTRANKFQIELEVVWFHKLPDLKNLKAVCKCGLVSLDFLVTIHLCYKKLKKKNQQHVVTCVDMYLSGIREYFAPTLQ